MSKSLVNILAGAKGQELLITTTRAISKVLKKGLDLKSASKVHYNVIKTLKGSVLDKYDSIKALHSVTLRDDRVLQKVSDTENTLTKAYKCTITGAYFEESIYMHGKNNVAKEWILNEEAYHLLITHLTRYKNARELNLKFVLAFKMMRDMIKNTHVATKPFYKKVDEENFSKISKVNKEHGRTEEIAGYFRSTRGKELSVLFGERTRLTNRLEGLFDIEILKQLNELDERIKKIEKTKVQSKLTTKVLDVKTIGKAVSKANLEYLATGEMNEDFLEEIKYKEFERDLDI